ncbi:response regulator transcription factor [Aeromonas aquatica]|uniref:response regulator transcription factor n=1 Tax=Aeromonas aquatica TaxID=558964 RepID=UPI000690EF10|nr:response regulator [Aeromonas aquatica]
MKDNVYLVDDDPAVRASLGWLLEAVQIRLQSYDGARSFLAEADLSQPGCLILDLCMPGMSGGELQEALNRLPNTLAIVFLTGEADVATTVSLFKQGAFDLLEKPVDSTVLLAAINRACAHSRAAHGRQLARQMLQARLELLSPREREIMGLVQEGMQNKQIADRLCIALRTAEIHRHNMMKKMGCTTPLQLVQLLTEAQSGYPARTAMALDITTPV